MVTHDALSRRVPAGELIGPWLILGPFYEDLSAQVQGLSLFERPGASVGRTAMADIVAEARPLLAVRPHEGEEARFRGQSGHWSLVRRPEKYLSWGTYNISNHLGAAFLATLVTPRQPGPQQLRLLTRITSRILVAVDGRVVFDSEAQPVPNVQGVFEHIFPVDLGPGEHLLSLALFRLARMAQVAFRLEPVDGALAARVPLAEGLTAEARARVEEVVTGIRLDRDIFYPEQQAGLRLLVAPSAEATLTVSLLSETGETLRQATPAVAGPVDLCPARDLPDGLYRLLCTWQLPDGRHLTSSSYEVRKLSPVAERTGYEHLEERKRRALAHYAANREGRPIWSEVARYALGRYAEVDEGIIRETCEFIAARKDCADFVIQGLLRLMYWERECPHLSPAINALMKDTVLGFKYWVDEPGDTVMYMGSENHRFLFHVAEWLAGQLFPLDEFTNSRQRGLYHASKGRMYITEWLRQRGRFGFDEWHSNSYYPINIAPLINVYDFAIYEDAKLRQMAGAVLDYMFFNLAADSLHGVFGTTHGRSYGINLKYPDMEGTSPTCWLLYGVGSMSQGSSGMSPVSVATSQYVLPRILAAIATDNSAVVESKQRQGILPGSPRHADFVVYRTPDYLLSGLQDHRKGEFESSSHVAQVTLGNKAVIFWSCPHTSGEGSGLRPDYWSGHTTLPRVIQQRNVLALTWRLRPDGLAWMTHCFFEPARFDEVRLEGKWAFARVGKGYVGVHSQNGMVVGDYGQYAGRELICDARENTWLAECGREADWGSFSAFVEALLAAPVDVSEDRITYKSPSIGRFVTGWDVVPTVNGQPIQLRGYPLVDSPWAQAEFGSGELTIRHGEDVHGVWFNQ